MRFHRFFAVSCLCLLAALSPSRAGAAPQLPNPNAPVITTTTARDYSVTNRFQTAASDGGACGPIDMVFVIDTTGSMGGALGSVDNELAGLLSAVETASGNNYRLALVTFKNNVTVNEGFAPNNRASIGPKILSLSPDGGGNIPEASDQALSQAVNRFAFRPDALKIAVLVTDAPPGGFDDTYTPGVDDVSAHLVAQQAAAKGIKISSIFVPTNGLDPTIINIMQTYASLSSGFYTQTASNGAGTGAGIQQVIGRCGGNVIFTQPADGQKLQELPAIQGKATPNEGETFSRVALVLQRQSDGLYWDGTAWVSALVKLPTTLSGTTWSAPTAGYALPIKDNLPNGSYKLTALAYDAKGKVSKSAKITVSIEPKSQMSLLDANTTQNKAPRDTAVADGVTQVWVKLTTSGPGKVNFHKIGDQIGDSLTAKGGSGPANGIPTETEDGKDVAYALYTVPKQLSTNKARVSFSADFIAKAGGSISDKKDLALIRPPVLLIHGLWSSYETWEEGGALGALNAANFDVRRFDYRSSSAAYFATNVGPVVRYIQAIKKIERGRNIAITQIDVVGHSMGGLLTRLAIQREGKTSENFGKGSVRRLITLGTPHYGSGLANALIVVRNNVTNPLAVLATIGFQESGHPISGAVEDLQLGSPALIGIDQTPVRAFAEVGNAPYSRTFGGASKLLYLYFRFSGLVIPGSGLNLSSESAFASSLFSNEPGDLIVGTTSQKGGIGAFSQTFSPVAHVNIGSVPGETASGAIGASVVGLLSGDENRLAIGFPDVTASSFSASSASALSRALQAVPKAARTDANLITLSPAAGTALTPGQSVELVATPVAGADVKAVLFAAGHGEGLDSELIEAAPFKTTFKIPADFTGQYSVSVAARDAAGNFQQIARVFNVAPTSAPTSLAIAPTSVLLTSQKQTEQLQVTGQFAGGALPLTEAVTGTTYSSANTDIVTVNANGLLTAKNSGIAVVTATNGGHSDETLVSVQFGTPIINSIAPQPVAPGARNLALRINGFDFGGVAAVEILLDGTSDPAITVGTPVADDSGTQITVPISVADTASVGKRLVVVTTPGGRSAEVLSAANTLQVGRTDADFALSAALTGTQIVGDELTYTVTVTNNGPTTASATVSFALPTSVDFVSARASQGTATFAGNVVTGQTDTLAARQQMTFTIVMTPNQTGNVTLTATATGDFSDPVPANNSASATATIVPRVATDVTDQVIVISGRQIGLNKKFGVGFNRRATRFKQAITLRNVSGQSLPMPLTLVVDGLSAQTVLVGANGRTLQALPAGSPYINLKSTPLSPGASETVVLEWASSTPVIKIPYTLRLLAGVGKR